MPLSRITNPFLQVSSAGSVSSPALSTSGDTNTGIFFPAADTIAFAEGGVEAMRINASGNLQTIGTISVGNTTPSTSGAGISFPATQSASSDANTLDDYEEGTWTPTLTGGTTNPTVTYGLRNAAYTKIGNVVTLFFRFQTTAISGGSGSAQISGLPFASNDTYRNGGALGYVSNITFGAGYTQAGLYNNPSNAILGFTLSGTGTGATEATISALGATLDVVCTYTYRV
jgi:hypothetical protein